MRNSIKSSLPGVKVLYKFISIIIFISSCQMPLHEDKSYIPEFGHTVFISTDSAESLAICRTLQESSNVKSVKCDMEDPQFEYLRLYVTTELEQNSSNVLKNIKRSLMTGTMGLFISNEATVNFTFRVHRMNNVRTIKLSERVELGMWTVLPVYTGLLGTMIGSTFNNYRRPDRLKNSCLVDFNDILKRPYYPSESCEDYMRFISRAFKKIENQFVEELNYDYLESANKE